MPPIRVALLGRDDRGGGFLEHLLVAALQRAVALAEMDGVALAVAEHLELDMARVAEIFLDIDGVVAERALRLGARLADLALELVLGADDLHAAPAAARGRLDDHRIAGLGGDRARLLEPSTGPSEPGTSGRPSLAAVRLASTLSPITRICSGLGPIQMMLWLSTISAKRAFSERKP
jgi:hypothetical protein